LSLSKIQSFEAVVRNGAHHKTGERIDEQKQRQMLIRRSFTAEKIVHQDRDRHDRGGGRDRQPDKIVRINRLDLHIEPR
jgi:hypothetical protein